MQAQLQSFGASVEAQAQAHGGTVELGGFLVDALQMLKDLAAAQVDTEAERDQIVAYVMTLADTFVGPRMPIAWRIVRNSIQSVLDEAIDRLPELLGGS